MLKRGLGITRHDHKLNNLKKFQIFILPLKLPLKLQCFTDYLSVCFKFTQTKIEQSTSLMFYYNKSIGINYHFTYIRIKSFYTAYLESW